MFWKKNDEFALPEPSNASVPQPDMGLDPNLGLDMPGTPSAPMPPSQPAVQQPTNSYSQFQTTMPPRQPQQVVQQPSAPQQYNTDTYTISKEIEVISSKLDALRAEIENINQKLSNLERMYRANRATVEVNRMPPRTY